MADIESVAFLRALPYAITLHQISPICYPDTMPHLPSPETISKLEKQISKLTARMVKYKAAVEADRKAKEKAEKVKARIVRGRPTGSPQGEFKASSVEVVKR